MIFPTPELGRQEEEALEQVAKLKLPFRFGVFQPRRWFGNLRRMVFARAMQGSNSIEGYHASLEDVMAVVEDEETLEAGTETVQALQGYRDAMTYVLQLAEEGAALDIDESLLKSLHYMMLKHDLSKRPGRWRIGPIYVMRDPGAEVVYEGPDAGAVPALVGELVEHIRSCEDEPLIRAAMAHLNLVLVHPFKDGNGRMARCLQTLILAQQSIVAPVFSSIEEYLGRNTDAYYAVLAEVGQGSWRPHDGARPWVRFCLNAHYQQIQTHLWRIREAELLWDRCEELARLAALPERAVGALSDASRGLRLRNSSYRKTVAESHDAEVDVRTASRDLHALVNAGYLIARGETRGRFYQGSERLRNVFREVRAQRPHQATIDLFRNEQQLPLQLPPG
jgi:Fic family protein